MSTDAPLNLGKPSLRRRLEAYYRQVAPDQVDDDHHAWKDRFDKIWEKFGGTIPGEQKLAAKLAKKYGSLVRLAIVGGAESSSPMDAPPKNPSVITQKDEADFEISDQQQHHSGVLSFTHAAFDPHAALRAPTAQITNANPWLGDAASGKQRLDRVDQCKSLLPLTDPKYQPALAKKAARTTNTAVPKSKAAPSAFVALAALHQQGPFSILYQAVVRRHRIRVVVRYLDGIRGTLTGHVLAFDKHCNLLLRNVLEVYSPHIITTTSSTASNHTDDNDNMVEKSRAEREIERRLRAYASSINTTSSSSGNNNTAINTGWTCRQRHLRQVLVRGDNVVLVYRADQEQSAWPVTKKSPVDSRYRRQQSVIKRSVPTSAQRVGTPGSLSLVVSQALASSKQHDPS